MKYGINIATLGDYANPNTIVDMALAAESAGWDGLFVWDHLAFAWGLPSGDPWIMLSAVAQATHTLKIGAMVTPIPRRRPQVLAHAAATLDILSNGRVIFGAGLGGVASEFTAFGDEGDIRIRAAKVDEGLEIISRLWAGENLTYQGTHFSVLGVSLAPLPAQQPRIPVWIGGESKAALRRAAKWDGWIVGGFDENGKMVQSPDTVQQMITHIRRHRTRSDPVAVAYIGETEPDSAALVAELEHIGVTWWQESLYGLRGTHDEMMARIKAGPPR